VGWSSLQTGASSRPALFGARSPFAWPQRGKTPTRQLPRAPSCARDSQTAAGAAVLPDLPQGREPARRPPCPSPAALTSTRLAPSRLARSPMRFDVLVVEDDAATRGALVALLGQQGYATAGARNGAEALAYLRAHAPPRVILLDLMMPVMDGQQFLWARRGEP